MSSSHPLHPSNSVNKSMHNPTSLPPLGSAHPSVLQVCVEHTGTNNTVRFTFPCSFEHVKPTPFDKDLNMQGTTMLMRAMVKYILNLILARIISSRTTRQDISSGGLRVIVNRAHMLVSWPLMSAAVCGINTSNAAHSINISYAAAVARWFQWVPAGSRGYQEQVQVIM